MVEFPCIISIYIYIYITNVMQLGIPNPQSAYAQHILQNIHEYGTLTYTMSLLKHIHNPTKLIPYEQLFIQNFHHHGNLISEQSAS